MEEYFFSNNLKFSTTVYSNLDGKGEYGFENNAQRGRDGFLVKYDKKRISKDLNCVDIGFFMINKVELSKYLKSVKFKNFSFEKKILPKVINKRMLYSFLSNQPYYYITSILTMVRCKKFLNKNERLFPKLF